MPSLRLVDLSFTRVGPPQIGEVANASITLEGRTCMARLTHIREPEVVDYSRVEVMPPPGVGDEMSMSCFMLMDFDWTTGDRSFTIGDTFTTLLIQSYPELFGLVLREMSDGRFKRVGAIDGWAELKNERSSEERCKILSDFVEVLPIRQVKII